MGQRRSVVITGAGSGIGRAVVQGAIQDGWYAVGIESEHDLADDLATLVGANGAVLVGDVRERAVLEEAAQRAVSECPLGAWVNNAAINRVTNLHDPVEADVMDVFAVNLYAYYWGSSTAIRTFIGQKSAGSVLSVSSVHARAAYPGAAAYDISKAGIEALMRYIAVEYGAVGIRANSVAPAAVMTPMSRRAIDATDDPDAAVARISGSVPLGRIAEAREVAAAITFLMSDEASYISGVSLGVDGGMSASCISFDADPAIAALYTREG